MSATQLAVLARTSDPQTVLRRFLALDAVVTGANGVATLSYAINSKSTGTGTYSIGATISKTGYTSTTGAATFNVQ